MIVRGSGEKQSKAKGRDVSGVTDFVLGKLCFFVLLL
jgi:hypothetical protein